MRSCAHVRHHRLVGAVLGVLASVAPIALVAPPARAGRPSATMTPDRNLRDGDIVTIRGQDFPPNVNVEMIECAGSRADPPKDTTACDGFTADTSVYSDRNGTVVDDPGDVVRATQGYRVWTLPTSKQAGMTISCDARHPCMLYVGVNFEDFHQPHVLLPVNYAPVRGGPSPSESGTPSWVYVVVVVALVVFAGALRWRLTRRKVSDQPDGVGGTVTRR